MTLPADMAGRAGPAKAAFGDPPVFAYIASLTQPQRGIAGAVDALAARTLPTLQRSVKWGMAYYGVGDGWCFSCGGFLDHVKLMFVNGATVLDPVPPVTPIGMGRATRGVELFSLADLDEHQVQVWMKQVTAVPGVGIDKHQIVTTNKAAHPSDQPGQNKAGVLVEPEDVAVGKGRRNVPTVDGAHTPPPPGPYHRPATGRDHQ